MNTFRELFSRDERQSLKRALKSTDPIYKLHQVLFSHVFVYLNKQLLTIYKQNSRNLTWYNLLLVENLSHIFCQHCIYVYFFPWQTIKFCKCTKWNCSHGTLSRTCFPAGSPRSPPWCCRCTTRTWSMWTGPTSLCSCGKDAKARGTWGARHYLCKFCARHQCWECQRTESYICNFLTNRHALLADDPRRRNTASAGAQKTLFLLIFWPLADWELHWLGFEMRPGGTEPWRLPPENAIPGTWCIILKVLLQSYVFQSFETADGIGEKYQQQQQQGHERWKSSTRERKRSHLQVCQWPAFWRTPIQRRWSKECSRRSEMK